MYRPPFHRRLLPWIYVAAFVATAPAVLFYTSGYRYDPDKGQVERTGTVILDSVPAGADIAIDGRPANERTPFTIRDMATGRHRFRLTRAGFSTWEKTLDVRPERVTFANDIHLWLDRAATLADPMRAEFLSANADGGTLFAASASTSQATFFAVDGPRLSPLATGNWTGGAPSEASWSRNGRFALLRLPSGSWRLASPESRPMWQDLPGTAWRWEGNRLVGHDGANRVTLNPPDQTWAREPEAGDHLETAKILVQPDGARVYRRSLVADAVALPAGDWHFWDIFQDTAVLRDGDRWLSIPGEHEADDPLPQASGDLLDIIRTRQAWGLVLRNGPLELWTWAPERMPDLLVRHSAPIAGGALHPDGMDAFAGDASGRAFAINLDGRDGRIETRLGTFARIDSLARTETGIAISGEKDGMSGIWIREIE